MVPLSRRLVVVVALALSLSACKSGTPATSQPRPSDSADAAGGAASREEVRYLALGDSFTIGTGSTPEESFPARLAARWREHAPTRSITLKNLGVNGYTTTDLTNDELPRMQGFRPTFVTLAIGANDRVEGVSNEVYRAHVRAILQAIVAAKVPPKSIVALPQPEWSRSPAASSFGTPAELGAAITAMNTILRAEAEAIGARYLDLYPLMQRQAAANMLARDGLHPSARAYDEWAAAIFESIPSP